MQQWYQSVSDRGYFRFQIHNLHSAAYSALLRFFDPVPSGSCHNIHSSDFPVYTVLKDHTALLPTPGYDFWQTAAVLAGVLLRKYVFSGSDVCCKG